VTPRSFGIEAITDEDRAYAGSRFSDARDALFANPYQRTWGAAGEPALLVHPVTLTSLLYGILPGGPPYAFRQAIARAVDSAADLRWGPDRRGFRRLVHPNGIWPRIINDVELLNAPNTTALRRGLGKAEHSPALPDCGARKGARRAQACAELHGKRLRHDSRCGRRRYPAESWRSSMLRAIPLKGRAGNSLKASFWATL